MADSDGQPAEKLKGKRGGARVGAGRPRGSPNKVTAEVRAALKLLVDENVGEMREWFKKQWRSDDGGKVAANLLSRLIEFSAPKLQRTDLAPANLPEGATAGGGVPSLADFFDTVTRIELDGVHSEAAESIVTARPATAADFGMAEPVPSPRALPAPEPGSLLARLLAPRLEDEQEAIASPPAAAAVEPLEGEVLPRDPLAEARRSRLVAEFQAEFKEWQRRADEFTAAERERLGNAFYNVTERELLVVLGPRPRQHF